MGTNNEALEITIEETGEIFKFRPAKLVNDTRAILLSLRQMQIQSMPWSMLSEEQQSAEIRSMDSLANDLVMKIVDVVARGDMSVVHAKLEKFTIKDGTAQIVASGRADDAAVVQINRFGDKELKIMVLDGQQFDTERDKMQAQPDQGAMFDDEDDIHGSEPQADDQSAASALADAIASDPAATHNERMAVDPEYAGGFDSCMAGHGHKECPFEEKTDEFDSWHGGWAYAFDNSTKPTGDDGGVAAEIIEKAKPEEQVKPAPKKRGRPKKEPTPKPDDENIIWQEGANACRSGKTAGSNPHVNADARNEWAEGYEATQNILNELENAGYQARSDGETAKSGYDADTAEDMSYMTGYMNAMNAQLDADTATE